MRTFIAGTTKIDVIAHISREDLELDRWCSVGLRDRRQLRTPPFERSSTAIAALALGRHRYELKQRKAVRLQFVQDGHASDEQNQKLQ